MRYLMLIDDSKMRKEAFSQAEKILGKIDRFELNLATFHNDDQKLFNDWMDLTFRVERDQIARLDEEYRQLCRLHNWMLALSEMIRVSFPKACALIIDEEAIYQAGDADTRRAIDKERAKRDEFIRAQMEREYEEAFGGRGDSDFGKQDEFDFGDRESDHDTPGGELAEIAGLKDSEIRRICADTEDSLGFFSDVLEASEIADEYSQVFRVWEIMPRAHRSLFAKAFQQYAGRSFDEELARLREIQIRHEAERASGPGRSGTSR